MSRTQEELAVSFLFLIDGRPTKEWLPALLTAVGDNNRWDLWRALNRELKLVSIYTLDPSEVHEKLEQLDENTTASDELIYNKLIALEMGDGFYDYGDDAVNNLIQDLRDEGFVFENWSAERASYRPHRWFAEGGE